MKRVRWQKLSLAVTALGVLTGGLLKAVSVNPSAAAASYGSFTLAVIGVVSAFAAGNVGEHKVNPPGHT